MCDCAAFQRRVALRPGNMHVTKLQCVGQCRTPLWSYYSPNSNQLVAEIQQAYLAAASATTRSRSKHDQNPTLQSSKLLALVVPHGAACDGFHVAAHAYQRLATYLQQRRCSCLTAVLIGTEHRGSTPIALSQRDWQTPLGVVPVNTAAVDYLTQTHNIPINEAPHDAEHSIENQLPFLVHAASWGWDLAAAGCIPAAAAAASPDSSSSSSSGLGPIPADRLSIVPISVGNLGAQLGLIQQYGAAVADLLRHLRSQQRHTQQQQHGGAGVADSPSDGAREGEEVVLIMTSDFTHAGPWYRELPPPGVSLEAYMQAQDTPVLQAVQQASVDKLLAAAAATRNSMCGLSPLTVAMEALYGSRSSCSSSSGSNKQQMVPGSAELLVYTPAHLICHRADSTGFASFAVYSKLPG